PSAIRPIPPSPCPLSPVRRRPSSRPCGRMSRRLSPLLRTSAGTSPSTPSSIRDPSRRPRQLPPPHLPQFLRFRRALLPRPPSRRYRQPFQQIDHSRRQRQIDNLFLAELFFHNFIHSSRHMRLRHVRDRFHPRQRCALLLRVERSFLPRIQLV